MTRLAVLITCFNRRLKTLACLDALFASSLPVETSLHVVLVDDGSTDGTEASVRERFPSVEIIKGDGNLFWNGGMHVAFSRALEIGYEGYVWLNDDTILYPSALKRMVVNWQELKNQTGADAIIVGTTRSGATGELTYGGISPKGSLRRLRFALVKPDLNPVECQSMNGNCVLIPNSVARRIGNLDPRFAHAMGDIDYGLRAGQAGVKVYVAPGIAGECSRNSMDGSFLDRTLPIKRRWELIMSPKGLPPKSWWIFTRRHGGLLGPVYWVWPYIKVWF